MSRIFVLLAIALSSCASTPKFDPLVLPELTPIELSAGSAFIGEPVSASFESEPKGGTSQRLLAFVVAIRRDSTLGTSLEGVMPSAFSTPVSTVRAFLERLEARGDVVFVHKSASDVVPGEVLETLTPASVPAVVGWDILQLDGSPSATPREREARAGNGLRIRALRSGGVEAQLELIASLPASRAQSSPWAEAEPMPVTIPLAAVQVARSKTLRDDEALVLCGTYPQEPWPRVIAVVLRSGESSAAGTENGNPVEPAP